MLTTWMTEIVSNTATANIVLPILAQMAETIHVNPLYLMIPAAATYVQHSSSSQLAHLQTPLSTAVPK